MEKCGLSPCPLPADHEENDALSLPTLLVKRVPECPAVLQIEIKIASLGAFSVISRPLTDAEITASSYPALPVAV